MYNVLSGKLSLYPTITFARLLLMAEQRQVICLVYCCKNNKHTIAKVQKNSNRHGSKMPQ